MEASTGGEFPASGVGINDLPDEVLVKIFSHSTMKELMDVTQNVCTRWRRLSHDPELWQHKAFCIDAYCSDDEAVLMLRQMPQLRTLLMRRSVGSAVLKALVVHCNHLTTLELNAGQDMSVSLLKRLVQKCANIQSLKIPEQFLWSKRKSQTLAQLKHLQSLNILKDYMGDCPVYLQPFADGCPQLSRLKVEKNVNVPFDDIVYFLNKKSKTLTHVSLPRASHDRRCIVSLLKDCTSLGYLQLSDCRLTDGQAAEAFTALGRLTNLHTLSLNNLQNYPAGAPDLAFQSGGLSRLQGLGVSNSHLEDSTLLTVCTHCPELKQLYLHNNYELTSDGLRQLYRLRELQVLHLSRCSHLRGGALACVAQLPNLRKLFLNRVEILEDSDLESILDATSLEVLSLNDNYVTSDSFFDRIPERLTNLRRLDVRNVGMHDALDRLEERMPGLEMDRYESEPEPDYGYGDCYSDADS